MAKVWYYAKGEERHGPLSAGELKTLASSGELLPDDLIWKEGLPDWRPASDLKGLFSDQAAAPAPAAAPPAAATPTPSPAPAAETPSPAPAAAAAAAPAPAVADTGFPVVGESQEPAPLIDTSPSRSTRRRSGGHTGAWLIPQMLAAMLLIIAMFLPWWSFQVKGKMKDFGEAMTKEVDGPDDEPVVGFGNKTQMPRRPPRRRPDEKKMKKLATDVSSSLGWYLRNLDDLSVNPKSFVLEDPDDEMDIRGTIWGWNSNIGLGGAFVGFAVLPLAIGMVISPAVRRFSWVSSFLAGYAGLILTILGLMWYLETPGFDIKPVFTQNASVGPYLAIGGSVVLLIFGLVDGLAGMRRFLRSQRSE